jgi:hypothetical protein
MLKLPLNREEALLLRRILEHSERILVSSSAAVSASSLTRQAQLFAAEVIVEIRGRLEGLMLKGEPHASTQE